MTGNNLIFRYPGGKSKKSIREKIMKRFPDHYKEFRDAMVGGGGIFFGVPADKHRWINDADNYLIEVYKALRDRADEFIAECRKIQSPKHGEKLASAKGKGKELYNARLKGVFDRFAKDEEMDQALRYFFVQRTVWAGRVNYGMKSRMYFSNPNGWNIVDTERLDNAAETMKGVQITCGDYHDVLEADGKDVLIYIDPPYYLNSEFTSTSRLYRCNFEKEDHDQLFKAVKACKHKVVISYDNHPYIAELYSKCPKFKLHEEEWTYCGTSSAEGASSTKEVGKELIITNF